MTNACSFLQAPLQLLARARYNNVAEAADELSFQKGDIVTVLQKDHNKQVDWWLCELRGTTGMVPANYFEIFHDHDTSATYDIPRPSSKSSSHSSRTTPLPLPSTNVRDNSPIYDIPPAEIEGATDRDYDLPPLEFPSEVGNNIYDRPPSSNRISPLGSTRSSVKSNNRISSASSATSSNCIYDVPPDLADVYDFPKPNQPAKGFEEEERQPTLLAVDISSIYDNEAEELLAQYRQLVSATYEVLYQSVYGPEAYWGSDNKSRRASTMKRTVQSVKHFDRALVALLEFGKGVVNALDGSSDTNFKKKYTNAFRGLLQNRNDILMKLDSLNSEIDSITATVKSLLEVARIVPRAVTEFTVLVQANKALLFKPSKASTSSLPVLTKTEVKVRPLPELPTPHNESDYAIPVDQGDDYLKPEGGKIGKTLSESALELRKRKPNDELPPLPYATVHRPGRSPGQRKKTPPEQTYHTPPPRNTSPYGTPYSSRTNHRQSPISIPVRDAIESVGDDYDEIDKGDHRERAYVITSRPSMASLGSAGSSRGTSPTQLRLRRQQSLSSCSGSSEDLNLGLRRANSAELLDGPYGHPNGLRIHHERQTSSPQPLRREDKELLERFSKQLDLIVPSLRETIDVFLDCIKDSEPPKDFVTKSKLTVVSAYKLVYIADALTQKILHNETKTAILTSSNCLTESIKNLVSDTKTAALQYPSVIALEKMGASLRQLFPSALDLVNSVKARAVLVF